MARIIWLLLLTLGCVQSTKGSLVEVSASGGAPITRLEMPSQATIEARLRGALWSLFAGDALAAPTHWYYGGAPQIRQDYGKAGITGYTKSVTRLRGSIMSKSNTSGGGRGAYDTTKTSIVGDVINHGKKQYWKPGEDYHYHVTLAAGENTLEASLARLLLRSVAAGGGTFDAERFRDDYVEFMQRPGSHNDTYASTCHRMFFANLVFQKRPPAKCPDNDGHNVDTIDGLVLPSVAALAAAARAASAPAADPKAAGRAAAIAAAAVTRESRALADASARWSDLLVDMLLCPDEDKGDRCEDVIDSSIASIAASLGFGMPNGRGEDMMVS